MPLLIQAGVCVLAAGLLMAGILWALPHMGQLRTMRQFRKQLRQLELVAMIWEQSVGTDEPRRQPRPERRHDNPA
jgi:hypothetical protein